MAETEDAPYTHVDDDFASQDADAMNDSDEEQTAETALIKEIRKYLKEAKAQHDSFDVIDLTEASKMNPTQQIAAHKWVVHHLREIEQIINNKVKESP